jgi:integrase/recombinase XerD
MAGFKARLHLAYEDWPSADRLSWEQAFADDDPFGNAAGVRLAISSRQQYLNGWRRFLGFLASEEPEALDFPPEERLDAKRVRRFVAHLAGTNIPRSVAIQVDALYKAARIMLPELDLAWLRNMKARLHAAARSAGATGPVVTSLQLLELGEQLMVETKLQSGQSMSLVDAIKYRDGLMFAFTAYAPVRPKNTVSIEIGRHLIKDGEHWALAFSAEETKTKVLVEFAIPERLASYLETYLKLVRPRLLRGRDSNALWISTKGGKLSSSAVGNSFARHSSQRLGIRLAPHDVRDAGATFWAIARPAQIGVAQEMLGHSDPRTMQNHYNRARGIEATRAFAHCELTQEGDACETDALRCPLSVVDRTTYTVAQ